VKLKMKTKSAAKKRLKVTGSGKIKYKKSNLRHILTSKAKKRKRHLRKHGILSPADTKHIAPALPYAGL
jgi:large subunit ribosomal protein L35